MKRAPVIALLAVVCALPGPAAGQTTTSAQLPIAAIVQVPLSDASFDTVALSGRMHVLTHLKPDGPPSRPEGPPQAPDGPPVRIRVNLDTVAGVGDVSGFRYVATGTNRINLPGHPADPMHVSFDLCAHPTDPIIPPDPVQPGDQIPGDPMQPGDPMRTCMPLDITFTLKFSLDSGVLSSVTIESISVPLS